MLHTQALEDSSDPSWQWGYESGCYYSVLADLEGTGLQPFSKRENIQQEKTQGEVRFPGKTSLGIKRYAHVVGSPC